MHILWLFSIYFWLFKLSNLTQDQSSTLLSVALTIFEQLVVADSQYAQQ